MCFIAPTPLALRINGRRWISRLRTPEDQSIRNRFSSPSPNLHTTHQVQYPLTRWSSPFGFPRCKSQEAGYIDPGSICSVLRRHASWGLVYGGQAHRYPSWRFRGVFFSGVTGLWRSLSGSDGYVLLALLIPPSRGRRIQWLGWTGFAVRLGFPVQHPPPMALARRASSNTQPIRRL